MPYICILGRQPALGLAELESCFGSEAIQSVQPGIALLNVDAEPDFNRLGGIQKAARLLTNIEHTDIDKASRFIQKSAPDHLQHLPKGKINIGMSVYGLSTTPQQVNAAALSLKKVVRQQGRSARVVPNNELVLGTPQIIHNKLTGPNGWELNLIRYGQSTLLAQTIWVQDIDAYRRRDQERPARDARVGMLPPKLAQIILNLASTQKVSSFLDPFCGTGVLLQEGLLQDYDVHGTDIEPRMIDYSKQNLEWLVNTHNLDNKNYSLRVADATSASWNISYDTVACETYLGRALSSPPDSQTLTKIISDVDLIHKKFFKNLTRQTDFGLRICIAVPAWRTKGGFKHLPILDHLEELGYNRLSFVHAADHDLIYHREGQIVARELVVLTRK